MKLGDYFRTAIQDGDWQKVCKVFTKITGEHIDPPVIKVSLADMSMEEDDSPASMDMDDEDSEDDIQKEEARGPTKPSFIAESKKKDAPQEDADGKKRTRREALGKPKNTFVDRKTLVRKDLPENNPQLANLYVERAEREIEDRQDTGKRVRVQCSLCEEWSEVSPIEAVDRYSKDPKENTFRCNTCCTPKGRARNIRKKHAK